MTGALFSSTKLDSFLEGRVHHIRQKIQAGDLDGDIRKDPKNVMETLRKEYELERVCISKKNVNQGHTCRGSTLTVLLYTTFKGDPRLLEYQPSSFKESVPGNVERDRIITEITGQLGRDDFKRMLAR